MVRKTIEQDKTTLPELLRQMRKDAGKYQSEIADMLGVKSVTYSAYETGRIVPSADKLYALAKLYGVNAEVFLQKIGRDTVDISENDNGRIEVPELKKIKDDTYKLDELVYYYKNLSDSQKNAVYELTKSLYKG
ncbi:MAG: helix-turn-helix transcriptional regulator [Butyrivibrio sp.]|nr:helix-turn-helix transcriptional regulator [Butyrivibrio sp.]